MLQQGSPHQGLSPSHPKTSHSTTDDAAPLGQGQEREEALLPLGSALGVQQTAEERRERRKRRRERESARLRRRAVEGLWRITEELNVLYKDNWTAMADRQLEMFQTDLLSVAGASDSYKVSQDQVLYQKALKQKHVGAVVNAAATITDAMYSTNVSTAFDVILLKQAKKQ